LTWKINCFQDSISLKLALTGGAFRFRLDWKQTHMPKLIWATRNLTKMFHVKHFCPVEAKILTNPKTAAYRCACKIDQYFGAIGIGRQQARRWVSLLPKCIPDVRFADECESVLRFARAAIAETVALSAFNNAL
jgi:hypothetical protein